MTDQTAFIKIGRLPQVVPSRVCLSCEICCRFPESDSFLRPYFTAEEIRQALDGGIDPSHFPTRDGCQISVVPHPRGEGYLCPAFDPLTSHCRIYESRPLDCQIYPLAVMWSADRSEVLLGWDSKCPYLQSGEGREASGKGSDGLSSSPSPLASSHVPDAYADRIAALLERDDMIDTLAQNRQMIGRFQEDVVVLRPLVGLTARLRRETLGGRGRAGSGLSPQSATHSPEWTSHALPLTSLTLADRPRVDHALASSTWMGDMPLAAYAFVYHYIWRSMLTYSWTEIDEHLCLFAESPDGLFMPLLPLGPEPLGPSLAGAMELMRRRNGGSSISRVENVPEEQKTVLEALDYRLSRKDSDYLYRASDLCEVAGDRYKSQRAACNRFEREHRAGLTSYRTDEQEECLSLFRIWSSQKVAQGLDEMARYLLADTESAHHEALANHEALGLTGAVLRVEGAIRAYTLGYRLSPTIFCVLLEVADRTIPGLAPFLFRETCRTARSQGASFINTMDDSGLSRLAASKQAYRPIRLLSNWIVTPA